MRNFGYSEGKSISWNSRMCAKAHKIFNKNSTEREKDREKDKVHKIMGISLKTVWQ